MWTQMEARATLSQAIANPGASLVGDSTSWNFASGANNKHGGAVSHDYDDRLVGQLQYSWETIRRLAKK
jgi:hypothetical protein